MGVVNSAGVAYMSKINLTKAWNKSALPYEDPEISPPEVNVFAIDTSGNQMQQRERNNIAAQGGPVNFGSHDGGKADARSSRKGTDGRFLGEWLQLMSPSYQRAYHQFIETADSAIEFYDQFDRELDQMKAELEEFKAAYDKNTIRMSDGRRVYVDENGEYAYQDAYGNWNKLEDSAVAEAKTKHQILGDQTITKAQKVRLDEYESKLEYADAMKNQNRQQATELKKAAENGDLSQDELEEGEKEIDKNRQEIEEMRKSMQGLKEEIANDVKPIHSSEQNMVGGHRNNQMFGKNLNNEQPPSTPPSIG
jgi:hypothetical protein